MSDALQIIKDKLDGTGIKFTADESVVRINYYDLEDFLELFSNFDRDDINATVDGSEFFIYIEGVKMLIKAEQIIL
ncbi:MAG: hypothetical protein WC307_01210 [Candidatus Nanoarchaeia archaeon]|jgi:hypothetical protein